LIPSLSWSYTAGAKYRLASGQLAQLIFGGYDPSRFLSNGVSFPLSSDINRDIVVAIQSISYSGESTLSLLNEPIYAFIESTDVNIWLPLDACKLFESAFGITYNDTLGKYLLNTTHFNTLSNMNPQPSVTFHLAVGITGGSTVAINLPFSAFSLVQVQYPFVPDATYYFPLQRAANSTQYTLGRTFLQEAYLTVDYDSGNFSVSQATWIEGATPQLVPILASEYSSINNSNINSSNNSSSTNATAPATSEKSVSKASAVVPAVAASVSIVALLAIGVAIFFWFRQRKAKRMKEERQAAAVMATVPLRDLKKHDATNDKILVGESNEEDNQWEKGSMFKRRMGSIHTVNSAAPGYELGSELGSDGHEIHQLSAGETAVEMGGTDVTRYELDSSMPVELYGSSYPPKKQVNEGIELPTSDRSLLPSQVAPKGSLRGQHSIRSKFSSASVSSTSELLPIQTFSARSGSSRGSSRVASPNMTPVFGPVTVSPIASPLESPWTKYANLHDSEDGPAG
jgi:hypothetical protein